MPCAGGSGGLTRLLRLLPKPTPPPGPRECEVEREPAARVRCSSAPAKALPPPPAPPPQGRLLVSLLGEREAAVLLCTEGVRALNLLAEVEPRV